MFLLRDGSFTLMKIASLKFLAIFQTRWVNSISGLTGYATIRWINKTTVFRKPTHTDMYLHWDSYHHLSANYSVINTLRHREKTVLSGKQLLTEEEDHLYNALNRCKYPLWAWNRTNIKKKQKKNNQGNNNTKKSYIVVPYMKGLGETCKNICGDVVWRCTSEEAALSEIF